MRRLLLSLLALPLLVLGLAAPASAVPVIVSFTADGQSGTVTVEPGADVDLSWNVTGDEELVVGAFGDWSGRKDPVGTQTVTGPAAGESLTFSLTAGDGSTETDVTRSVTVTAAAEEEGSTPPPVTVEDCLVTVPSSDDFDYEIVYDGDDEDTEPIEAGTYTSGELTAEGDFAITIVAVPRRGVTVAEGATTEFDVPFSEECGGPNLIDVAGGTCSFDVENVSDGPLDILYGNPRAGGPDGEFTLAAGASRTVRTNRTELIVVGVVDVTDEDSDFEVEPVEVSQRGCSGGSDTGNGSGRRWPVPVNAPAAGVTVADGTSGSAPWLLAALLVASGLVSLTVRKRAAS